MEKIYVLTDSASDLERDNYKDQPLSILPFWINFKDVSYRDRVDLFSEEFYKLQAVENPKTSVPSVLDVEEEFRQIKENGYTHVVCITIAAVLSGISNVCSLAENQGLEVFVFDTKTVSMSEGFFAHYALERIGEGVSFNTLIEELEGLRDRSFTYFTIANLKYLKEGGRIGHVKGTVGDLLNIKPIITVGEEGELKPIGQVKGRRKSMVTLAKMVKDMVKDKKNYYLGLSHGNTITEMEKIEGMLEEEIQNAKFYFKGEVATVVGTHAGPGVLAVYLMIFD